MSKRWSRLGLALGTGGSGRSWRGGGGSCSIVGGGGGCGWAGICTAGMPGSVEAVSSASSPGLKVW
ncbi:MAG: hypothetical protein JXR96_06690 [Deltaproteobacteria bacterium]|nr:hypothetical protein [Deltaproteobacteria bacterium]